MTTQAYPLSWPAGRPRTNHFLREAAKFECTFTKARDNLVHEVQLLVGRYSARDANIIISSNLALRRDGLPLAGQRQPDDVGVAVYFTHKKRPMSFACDRWQKIEHNMQAIAKTIEALRGIARWGTGDMLEAAFTGFLALPPPSAERPWWDELGVSQRASNEEITQAYRRLRSEHHPDRGGNEARFDAVEKAYRKAIA